MHGRRKTLSTTLVALCSIAVTFVRCEELRVTRSFQIHEYMTPDEVMSIFHSRPADVPDYELVPVQHTIHKRSVRSPNELQLTAFDSDVKLYLNPNEGYLFDEDTPVWTARSDPRSPGGIKYQLVSGALVDVGIPYQDVPNSAALVILQVNRNKVLIDGTIGPNTIIRSLPMRLLKGIMYGKNGLYDPHFEKNATDDLAYTYHHVVYKRPQLKGSQYADFTITNPDKLPKHGRHRRELPDVIYPQVLVIADYHEYSLLGRDLDRAKRYLVSFWNGVDLRYRLLTTPRIRFNIAGIVIALDADAIPYLERNRRDEALVDADRALRSMGSYFYRENRFPAKSYDMAVAMTQLDMCNMMSEDICDTSTLGYAFVAGACDRNERNATSEAVGIVEDNGGFSGIIPAAHEVGHLIGARHDGNPKGAGECPPYEGFIMTGGLLLNENGFEWSKCSVNAFFTFLNEDRAKCLYDKPRSGKRESIMLPGKLMDLDAQCKQVYGTTACNKDATVCTRLECVIPGTGGICKASAPAAEGSPCGDGMYCLNGKCVLKETSIGKRLWTEVQRKLRPVLKFQVIKPVLG